jgi:hypothetical protein
MSADSSKTPDSATGEKIDQLATIKSELDQKFAAITEQIKTQNDAFAQAFDRLANPRQPVAEVDDSDVFDAKTLNKKVTSAAASVAEEMIREERRKNATIYQMAQEYPEIHTDRELQKEIVAVQKTLPKHLQDTVEGYEMAVLKAVVSKGVTPKSKRQAPTEDDFSVSSSSSSRSGERRERAQSKRKVSDDTLIVAELLRGRELTDEEKKGLEVAAQRESYTKYR